MMPGKAMFILSLCATLAVGGFAWRLSVVNGKLALEQSNHSRTKDALILAIEERDEWITAFALMENAAQAQQSASAACLDREARALAAQAERTGIMQAVKPRQQTQAEKQQVVDDETRKRVADRLNRPL